MRVKILAGIYVFVLAVIIFLANGQETQYLFGFIRNLPFGDKIGHLLLMGFFSFLLNLALNARTIRIGQINLLVGTIIVLFVVTIEEVSQIFVSGRSFDLGDLAADFLGIIAFGELARFMTKRKTDFRLKTGD